MATRRIKPEDQARTSPQGSRVQGKITKTAVTNGMVEKRARELAAIAGREPNQVNDGDRYDARRELLGAVHPTTGGADEPFIVAGQLDSPPTSSGRRKKPLLPQDDQITKELVEEGVDEAEHDQMVQERKSRRGNQQ